MIILFLKFFLILKNVKSIYPALLAFHATFLGVRHAFLPHVGEERLPDEPVRTSAWEATALYAVVNHVIPFLKMVI